MCEEEKKDWIVEQKWKRRNASSASKGEERCEKCINRLHVEIREKNDFLCCI